MIEATHLTKRFGPKTVLRNLDFRVAQGEFQGKSHVTATEVSQTVNRGDIRLDENRDAMADMLTNIIRKYNQLIFKYWDTPRVIDIVGPDGAKWWIKYTAEEIRGEYDVRIDPFSAASTNPEQRKQDALEMARAWSEMNQKSIAEGKPVPPEIQRYFFSQYDGINVDKLLEEQGLNEAPMGSQQQPMNLADATALMNQRYGNQQAQGLTL